jgi:DNA invertase Pin-like site-specific DNA recombinase
LFTDAGISGKSLNGRDGLQAALQAVESGTAATLVVAKLDRLSRSLGDLCGLMARANAHGWAIVATDMGVDMTTPMGRAMAQMSGVFAELERHLIAQRTRDALAIKKAAGIKLGRPAQLPPGVVDRILLAAYDGLCWRAIADELNADRVPTAQGGRQWYPSTVRAVVLGGRNERVA